MNIAQFYLKIINYNCKALRNIIGVKLNEMNIFFCQKNDKKCIIYKKDLSHFTASSSLLKNFVGIVGLFILRYELAKSLCGKDEKT